jgi:hypothetical protein
MTYFSQASLKGCEQLFNQGFWGVTATMAGHYAVDHKVGIYATDKTNGTNLCENYFAQLKRGLKGT